jgi:hypothetical protein
MPESPTPTKTDRGWIITMPPEMAQDAGVAEGSVLLLYLNAGGATAEILPPATPELRQGVRRIADKFQDAFAEMKRRGD